jgi:hypothetical protein
MYDNEWKEKFLDEHNDNYQDKQKLEKILDDFVYKHIQFEKGKKSSLERLILPGMGDLYMALDKCN